MLLSSSASWLCGPVGFWQTSKTAYYRVSRGNVRDTLHGHRWDGQFVASNFAPEGAVAFDLNS